MIPQTELNDFFQSLPFSAADRLRLLNLMPLSGWSLVDKIQEGERVLDVGCGHNLFKERIPTLVGVDPVRDEADVKLAIQDWVTSEKFDVAFCLGSVQYGDVETIREVLGKVISLLNPVARIYWRSVASMPALTTVPLFVWTPELHEELAAQFGFVVAAVEDEDLTSAYPGSPMRLYAEWKRG